MESENFEEQANTYLNTGFTDADSVDPSEVHQHGVVISVPLLYVSTSDTPGNDKIVPNLRVIKFELLQELLTKAIEIGPANNETSMELCEMFIKLMMRDKNENEVDPQMKSITDFLSFAGKIAKEIDVDVEYIDVTTEGVSYDIIRNYVCDPTTGILISAEPLAINGMQLYSQLPSDEAVLEVRKQTNDTDFMRMQYQLAEFERILTFVPGHVFDKTMKLTNLSLFYLCLIDCSRPIDKMCSVDLKANIVGFMIDLIIRSRCIQAWQRDKSSQKLLHDMTQNHDKENPIIKLCQMTKPSQRAQYILQLLSKQREFQNISHDFTYELYEKILKDFEQNIEGHTYYCFNSNFITSIATNFPILDSMQDALALAKNE